MGNISLIIKDIKSLFLKKNLFSCGILMLLALLMKKSKTLDSKKKNLNVCVQDIQTLGSPASRVISFHY